MADCKNAFKLFPLTAIMNTKGNIEIGGSDLEVLASNFLTPLYVYDASTIRSNIDQINTALDDYYPEKSAIAYAAKAYFSYRFAEKLAAENVELDVVSLAELRIALKAGFNPDRIHLHGNNKSVQELQTAIDNDIHAIVADNMDELLMIEKIATACGKTVRIWLRITPDIHVATHPHIETSAASSKFGFHIVTGDAEAAIKYALNSSVFQLTGLHCHLGSQLFDPIPFQIAIEKILELAVSCQYSPQEISPGGGWGVPYIETDPENDPTAWVKSVSDTIVRICHQYQICPPKVIFESGRWLIAKSGVAIYRIGTHKKTLDGNSILAIDGGISDNPRNALYQAQYSAKIVQNPLSEERSPYKIVGKFCETGDVLIDRVLLPKPDCGDLLAIPVSGAYQLSMSSNYNLAPRPAVLWLETGGRYEILQQREEPEINSWWV